MEFSFSFGWALCGLAIAAIGVLLTVYYRPFADNFAHGVKSYDHVRLAGICITLLGFLIMANLHLILLNFLVSLAFGR